MYFTLQSLLEEYKSSPYMLSRLETHINQLLPDTLKTEDKRHMERIERKQRLTNEYTQFIEIFMLRHRYYYCPNSELFLEYDGANFIGCSEDDILHKILSTISLEKKLMPWKYRTNNDLICKIRQKTPLRAIPESATIQCAINHLYPFIFITRNEAKYFLTIIGDCICRKRVGELIYIISPHMKAVLQEISIQCAEHFGLGNILQCFKYKFYDHNYKACRLVAMKHNVYNHPIEVSMEMSKHMINILCVASHYSARYGDADLFLDQCTESNVVSYARSLCITTPHMMVELFLSSSLHCGINISISTKNMIYLWKKFLNEHDMPAIIFHEQLKQIFREKLSFDADSDSFLNITSIHLPIVSSFMQFWDTNITCVVVAAEESPKDNDIHLEYEIDEITILFRQWFKKQCNNLNDAMVIELISHFYPTVIIEEQKYIKNITCSLLNKYDYVKKGLDAYHIACSGPSSNGVYSLYSAYEQYTSNTKSSYIVSKCYFEKAARDTLGKLIDEYGIISSSWCKK